MNVSKGTLQDCTGVLPPTSLSYFSMTTSLIMSVFTVPGNIMVCIAVLKNPNNDLRNHFTLLIGSLALADLIAGSVTEPTAIAYTMLESTGKHPPETLVYTTHISYFISVQASVLTLVGLTSDRYLAITQPLWYRINVSTANASFLICLIWACAIGLSFIYFRVGFPLFSFIFANTAVAWAILVFVFSYIRIFKALRVRVHEMMSLDASPAQDTRAKRREVLWERKLTKTYLLMLSCFLACYVPSCVFIYALHFCAACSCATLHILRDAQFLLVLFSSSINPVLYAWRLSNFRRAFLVIVTCNRTRRTQARGRNNLVMKTMTKSVVIDNLEAAAQAETSQSGSLS